MVVRDRRALALVFALAFVLVPALGQIAAAQDNDAVAAGYPDQQYDSDWDGVNDATESRYGTDPYDSDTDGDGLRDGDEYNDVYGRADPTKFDTDSDGLGDGYEVFQNNSDPQLYDTDLDGRSDGSDVAPRDPYR